MLGKREKQNMALSQGCDATAATEAAVGAGAEVVAALTGVWKDRLTRTAPGG